MASGTSFPFSVKPISQSLFASGIVAFITGVSSTGWLSSIGNADVKRIRRLLSRNVNCCCHLSGKPIYIFTVRAVKLIYFARYKLVTYDNLLNKEKLYKRATQQCFIKVRMPGPKKSLHFFAPCAV